MAEAVIDFIHNGIILQAIGSEGMAWAPFLLTLFTFIFVCNIFEIIPVVQMPVTARMALPFFMTMIVFVIYHVVGVMNQVVRVVLRVYMLPHGVLHHVYAIVQP